MSKAIVVIGAGQAGAQLAISLRQGGFSEPILMIGEEPYLPYQRPPLSKKFLSEHRPPDILYLRPEGFWRDHDIKLELGHAVAAIDGKGHRITMSDGRELDYHALVIATGTSARTLPVPGAGLTGVYSLRHIDDVRRLRPALDAARRVAIIGGGYIGLEVAAVMRGENRDVTIVEAEDRVLKRIAGMELSKFFDELHRGRGVAIRLGQRLTAIEGEKHVSAVRIGEAESLPVDLVLIAAGARANDDLAQACGIDCRDGIIVDEMARTSMPDIYAVGDCARFPSRRYGRLIRLESVQNAIDQAKAAAASILGQPQIYDPVPWFWSDQYEIKLQIAGLADEHDSATIVGDVAGMHFSVEYRQNGRLIAVDAVNDARAHMMARRRIAEATLMP